MVGIIKVSEVLKMNAIKRRDKILEILRMSEEPISANQLASECGVSRQIIVGDVAILRASGGDIQATPRGYILNDAKSRQAGHIHRIACVHNSNQMEEELQICVDHGVSVLDVIVEHPVYGQLTAPLRLSTRYDISQFVKLINEKGAHALSELTEGVHLHTLSCPTEEAYERVCAELKKAGILYK